jgi:hypothetical protein
MGVGRIPAAVALDVYSGDRWQQKFKFTDGGDHNGDGIAEDPNNPLAKDVSGYTFTAQIRPTRFDTSSSPTAFSVDTTNAATGIIVLTLSPAQTAALLTPSEQKSSKGYVWDLQAVKASDTSDVETWYQGDVVVWLDVTRP